MLREEKGTKGIDFESGERIFGIDLCGGLLSMKDARDAEGEA